LKKGLIKAESLGRSPEGKKKGSVGGDEKREREEIRRAEKRVKLKETKAKRTQRKFE